MKKVLMISIGLMMMYSCTTEVATVKKVGQCTPDCFGCAVPRCSVELSNGVVTDAFAPVMEGQKMFKCGAWYKSNN